MRGKYFSSQHAVLVATLVTTAIGLFGRSASAQCAGPWSSIPTVGDLPGRDNHVMVYDGIRERVVLFGGIRSVTGQHFRDTWEWDGASWSRRATAGPTVSHYSAAAYDAARGVTLLFGGNTPPPGSTPQARTWAWDGVAWAELSVPGPSARAGHVMAADDARGRVVLFGGWFGGTLLGDTWEWDGVRWELVPAPPPPLGPVARRFAAAAFSKERGRVVMYGGLNAAGANLSDMWEWTGNRWLSIAQNGPPRSSHALASDATCLLMYAGNDNASAGAGIDATLIFRNGSWTTYTGSRPRARVTPMVYDDAIGRFLIFSGYTRTDPQNPADTWVFDTALGIRQSPTSRAVCCSGSAVLSIMAVGEGSIQYAWRKDGVPIDMIANPSAATSTLHLSSLQPSDSGVYDCTASNQCGSVTSEPATLSVCVGDFNCDGGIDGSDVQAFFGAWEDGAVPADVNGDGGIDGADVGEFFDAWERGC